jgi:putative DNA primase/helicase
MRRRLLLVPFNVQIPPEERDPELPGKLAPEWPAILRWAVEGAREWLRQGLAPPAIVQDASADYFSDQDTLGQWMAEWLDLTDCRELTASRELFMSWRSWCDDRRLHVGTQNQFTEKLEAKGLKLKRTNKQRGFFVKLIHA